MKERGEGKGRGVESREGAGDEMLKFELRIPNQILSVLISY